MRRAVLAALAVLAMAPAGAGMTVSFDTRTLNDVLPALTASQVEVPLSETRTITVSVDRMRILGLQPGTAATGSGRILASMRVRVPELGLDLPVQSRLSLHVATTAAGERLELRFEQVEIDFPLAGSIDIASFLDPLQFPAENVWRVEGAEGAVRVHGKLSGIEMGATELRFEFDLTAGPDPD